LSSSSLDPDPPVLFLKTVYDNGSYLGVVSATLTSNESFVVGANISAQIKIGLPQTPNTTYLIELMFPDAITYRDIPQYTWQQDWTYLLHEIQVLETEQIQTLSNITLVYAHEGLYGLNMTIHQPETNSEFHFHFYDLVQIKPMSYLQEKLRANLSFAMNFEILGLTIIMVAPIIVQLIRVIEQFFKGKTPENRQEKEPTQLEKVDPGKGSSSTNDQKPRKKRVDRAADLLNVQIYTDRIHTKLTSLLSFIFAYSIGLTVLFYTVMYQGLGPNPGTTWLVGLAGTWISTVAFLGYILRDFNKDMKAVSRMIEAIKEGNPLPEFEKLSRAFGPTSKNDNGSSKVPESTGEEKEILRRSDMRKEVDTALSIYRAFLSILSIIAGFVFAFIATQLFTNSTLTGGQAWTIRLMVVSLGLFLLVMILYQSGNKEMLRHRANILELYGKWSGRAITLGSWLTTFAILFLCLAVSVLLWYHELFDSVVVWVLLVIPTVGLALCMNLTFTPRNRKQNKQ
jgi:hypothetical protein